MNILLILIEPLLISFRMNSLVYGFIIVYLILQFQQAQ